MTDHCTSRGNCRGSRVEESNFVSVEHNAVAGVGIGSFGQSHCTRATSRGGLSGSLGRGISGSLSGSISRGLSGSLSRGISRCLSRGVSGSFCGSSGFVSGEANLITRDCEHCASREVTGQEVGFSSVDSCPVGVQKSISITSRVGVKSPVEVSTDSLAVEVVCLIILDDLIFSSVVSTPFSNNSGTSSLRGNKAKVSVINVFEVVGEVFSAEM